MTGQSDTPYLDALRAYAARDPGRFHVPGHKGGAGADPGLLEALGERPFALDIPALTYGIDVGDEPTPFRAAQELAAEAWGAKRTWWLINGASQGNHVALLTLGHRGHCVVTQRNAHSSTIDALIMSGLRPTFVSPELDPELHIAHCMTPDTLDRALSETPDAVGATVVSPTYFGAVADVAALAEVAHSHGVPLVVDEAWGAHLAFHEDLPATALSLGADLVISSTHKVVGSLTQSAMIHLGHGDLIEEHVVDRCVTLVESTSPSAILMASLDVDTDREHVAFAPPPPWGELAMGPREAFLGPQEVVVARDAVGRVAAESLAAYPPGIPNVLPGERLTGETLDYIEQTIAHGGSLRGASDRALRTLRVAVES